MVAASDPNTIIGGVALGGLAFSGLWRFIVWVREAPVRPDPWDAETEQKLSEPEAVEVCHRCLIQQPPNAWFCEHCGSAVGPYNNWMPYIHIFSIGEVLRNGVMDKLRPNVLTISGYLLLSVNFFFFIIIIIRPHIASSGFVLLIFAALLLYWFLLFKNLKRLWEEKPGEQPDGVQS
jgi:ribosomal protein L40E